MSGPQKEPSLQWGKTPVHILTSTLPDAAKVLYAYMAARVSPFNGPVYIHTRGYTAQALHWSDSKVRRGLRALISSRNISIESNRPGKSVYYRVHFAEPVHLGPVFPGERNPLKTLDWENTDLGADVTDPAVMGDRHPGHGRPTNHKMFSEDVFKPPIAPPKAKRESRKRQSDLLDNRSRLALDLQDYAKELDGSGIRPTLQKAIDKALYSSGSKSFAKSYEGLFIYVEDFLKREISVIDRLAPRNSGASSRPHGKKKIEPQPDLDWSLASPPPEGFADAVGAIGRAKKNEP